MRLCVLTLCSFLAFGSLAGGFAAAAQSDPSAVLSQARAALGGDAIFVARGLHIRSDVLVVGIKGTQEQWQDLAGGRYADYQEAGPISGADGYDGRDYWVRDSSGNVHVEGATEARLQAIDNAFLNGYALYRPDHGGATLAAQEDQQSGSATYHVVRVTPPGGSPLDLWFDARTGLPYRAVLPLGAQTYTLTLDDYRRFGGVMVAYHLHGESDTGNAEDTRIAAIDANPPAIDEHVRKPASTMHDFSMAGGAVSTSVPFTLIDNHVYLDVRLNGKGPFRFVFDSGGANLIDPGVLRELGVGREGTMQGSGVGSQTEESAFARLSLLQVGQARLTNQVFLVVPVRAGFGIAGGAPIDGLIGYEVLARYVTTYDYQHHRVVLRMPGTTATSSLGAPVPFLFHNNTPQISGRIDGTLADMTVDTGSRSAISILKPFADAHPNVVPATVTAAGVNGFGVGGASVGRLGRVASLQLGPYTVRNVIGDYSQQTKGAFADPYVAGNIGGAVWKRFSVTFDYPHQTMYLQPNVDFSKPENFDRSGMFLINRSGKVTTLDVRPGTPAAAAGMAKGDVIDRIDGRGAAQMSLAEIRSTLMRPAGTRLRLLVVRGSQSRTIELTLRDYV